MKSTWHTGLKRGRFKPVKLAAIVILVAVSLHAVPAHADRWVIECVECAKTFYGGTGESLQLDAAGKLHLAYGGDHLYYAVRDENGWQQEIVDPSPNVGGTASLDVDAQGVPHIVYYNYASLYLKYARRDLGGWHVETIVPDVAWPSTASIRVDADGNPHVSYVEVMGVHVRDVKYAHHDGTGWQTETVAVGLDLYDAHTSLALDASGTPHIAYYNSASSSVQYARRDYTGWHVETVDNAGDVGRYVSLAVDGGAKPHVAYFDETNRALKYAQRSTYGWQAETIDPEPLESYGIDLSLAIDGNGYVRISYLNPISTLTYEVRHAYQDTTGWHVETAYSSGYSAWSTSLVVDGSQRSHITYIRLPGLASEDTKIVEHLFQGASGWQVEEVDREGNPGQYVSLAVDSAGRPHVAFQDADRIDLKYAHMDGDGWHVEVADGAGRAGFWASLALDTADAPHVTYCGAWPEHPLRYAHLGATGWQTETVDADLAMIGGYPALALDEAQNPQIAYFDHGLQEMRYADYGEGGWQFETVEGDGFTGKFDTSLAVDYGGRPHVTFYNAADNSLHYAYRDAGTWHTEPVASMGYHGNDMHSTSVAIDSNGYPHIAYYRGDDRHLGYAYQDADGWHLEAPDTGDGSGTYVSIALDSAGNPHIAYLDAYPDYDLKYTRRQEGVWHTITVDSLGDVGRYVSLALDGDDTPHVAYYDTTEQCLKYAYLFRADYTLYLPMVRKP